VKLECFKSVVTCGNLSCVCVVVFFVYNIKISICNVKKEVALNILSCLDNLNEIDKLKLKSMMIVFPRIENVKNKHIFVEIQNLFS
jgi:hypothetical protein